MTTVLPDGRPYRGNLLVADADNCRFGPHSPDDNCHQGHCDDKRGQEHKHRAHSNEHERYALIQQVLFHTGSDSPARSADYTGSTVRAEIRGNRMVLAGTNAR